MDKRMVLFFPLISEGMLNNSHGSMLWPSFLLSFNFSHLLLVPVTLSS